MIEKIEQRIKTEIIDLYVSGLKEKIEQKCLEQRILATAGAIEDLEKKSQREYGEFILTMKKGISVRYSIGEIRVTKETYENWVRLK